MAKGFSQEVGIGVESAWGTAVEPTIRVLVKDAGLGQKDEAELTEIKANSNFPDPTTHELTKVSAGCSLTQLVYPSNANAIIEWGNARDVNMELTSLTIIKNEGITAVGSSYAGCKVASQSLKWSSDGLVELTQEFTAKIRAKDTFDPSGLSFVTGHPFKGCKVAVTVNGVTAVAVESGQIDWNNNLTPGPTGSDFSPTFLNEGHRNVSGNIKARFASDAWNALMRDATDGNLSAFSVVVTLTDPAATTPNNCVITIPSCRSGSAPLEVADQGATVFQTINFVSAGAPTVA